jgi:hypothetical protein
MKAGLGFSRGLVLDNRYVGRPMVCTSHLCNLKHTLPRRRLGVLESNIDLFSYTYPLPRRQGAGKGSSNLARGGTAVPMPKQTQSHQGAPREYPEKNGPRGLNQAVANHTDFISGRFLAGETYLVGYWNLRILRKDQVRNR